MGKWEKKTFQPTSWGRSTTPTSSPDILPPSGRSSSQATYPPSSSKQHPYSTHQADVLPIVSNGSSSDDESSCPVCLEPLSFSFKLPGEKPHIVPECGHALHEACFTAVYGPVVRGGIRQSSLGLCGVCRRPMKLGVGDNTKGNKLASLTGVSGSAATGVYPGRDRNGSRSAASPRGDQSTPTPYDPTEDDPLDHAGSFKSGSSDPSSYIVTPAIQVRPEFGSITRTNAATQPLTCIVIVELPSRRPPQPFQPSPAATSPHLPHPADGHLSPNGSQYHHNSIPDSIPEEPEQLYMRTSDAKYTNGDEGPNDRPESMSSQPFSYNATPSATDGPFASVVADLKSRMYDWKGHELSGMGPLLMFDILGVRRETVVREFIVYLFREAILCVLEEKKKSLGRLLYASGGSSGYGDSGNAQNKGVLRLKGRIYVRHIKRVIDTSVAGELSLTIDMEDERLDSFILIFKNRGSLESWRTAIIGLVTMFHDAMGRPRTGTPSGVYALSNANGEMEEFGISGRTARVLSVGSADTSNSSRITSHDSIIGSSHRSTVSSNTTNSRAGMSKYASSTYNSDREQQGHRPSLTGQSDSPSAGGSLYHQPPPPTVTARSANGASNSLTPVSHTALDLICVISVPPPSAHVSTASLKTRVIKTSLEFIMASMGVRDRLSLVTFEVGIQGRIRKTPFLSLGRSQSRQRLTNFIDTLSDRKENDEFFVPSGRDEKTDVVTAVNHGLDVVLQRKHKNPVSGLILVSDAADSTRRAQMDLVLARAEAANIPIHSFGYGKSHDPASLWLMSNHTNGTYTFVREWYDLRDCMAGCVGGMMSIALTNVKLHMRVVDGVRFRMRKVSGAPHAIVATDGHDVHVDIGELRYGEKKEMLVELELDNTMDNTQNGVLSGVGTDVGTLPNATDQFVRKLGPLSLSGSSANLVDGIMERLIDEVPVFELDGSFYDPAVAKMAARLANPVLLTVTLIPSQSPHKPPATSNVSDVVIVRRRMELLASDMITRALVLIARKNYNQAQKIIEETKRILQTVLQNVSQGVSPVAAGGGARSRKELLSLAAVRTLQSMLQDLQTLIDALEDNVDLFQHDHRNFGAQQAMILRDQKSWTGRTPTEKLFWCADNSLELVSRSHDWVSNVSRE